MSAARREDHAHVTGAAQFAADVAATDALHIAFVRSSLPHASIDAIRTADAKRIDGVLGVFTASDFAGHGPMPVSWSMPAFRERLTPPPLLATVARFVGDPLAVVVADDPYVAADAVDAVEVEYDELPFVTEARTAIEESDVCLHVEAPDNMSFEQRLTIGDVATALQSAPFVGEAKIRNQRLVPSPIEPRSTLATFDASTDTVTMHLSTQAPHVDRTHLAQVAGIAEQQLRIVVPAVGGGFGAKLAVYREDAVILLLARRFRRSVRWTESRSENFVAMTHGRDHDQHVRVGADAEGRIVGMEVDCVANMGAYVSTMAQGVPGINFATMVGGNYDIANMDVRVRGALTNTTPTDTYRGAGRPEATHLTERAVELVASMTGVPAEVVRQRNFLTDLPRPNALGLISYDSGDYQLTYNRLLKNLGIEGERTRQATERRKGRLLGVGTAMYVEFTGVGPSRLQQLIGFERGGFEQSIVRMEPDGRATVLSGLSSHGQGHLTTLAAVAAEVLHIPAEHVVVRQNDTEIVPLGNGTFNSRSMPVGASAVVVSAQRVVDKATMIAAELLEASSADVVLDQSGFFVRGVPSKLVGWRSVCRSAFLGGSERGIEPGLEATAAFDPEGLVCSYGAHGAVVEVDQSTGEVRIDRIVAVDDCGTVLNSQLAAGQVHGGLAQGIGQALFEDLRYDSHGYPSTGSFFGYSIPRASDLPMFETDHTIHPSPHNPLGVKGIGEAGTVGIPPAVHAAVLDALAPLGVQHLDMPLTAESIWLAIDGAEVSL